MARSLCRRFNKWYQDHVLQNPLVKHMLCLCFLTFIVILPVCCYRLPNSVYMYKSNDLYAEQEKERNFNNGRLQTAENYLSMLNRTKIRGMLDSIADPGYDLYLTSRLDLVVSIVTVSRNKHRIDSYEPKYLTQSVATLLEHLLDAHSNGFPYSVKIILCNVDPEPKSYSEAQAFKNLLYTMEKFANQRPPSGLHKKESAKQDYQYCIEQILAEFNPRYLLMLEDDIIPHEDLFNLLENTISNHPVDVDSEHIHEVPLYYKLYHPERLLGFINLEVERLPELLAVGAILGSIMSLLYLTLVARRAQSTQTVYAAWIVCIVYVMLVFVCIGRSNVLELRRLWAPHLYEYTPAPSCCTQAMLFTNTGARAIGEHLKHVTCGKPNNYGKDMAIYDYMRKEGAKALAIQPNLVTHIGMYTSLGRKLLDPELLL